METAPAVVPAKAGTQGHRSGQSHKQPCVYILASKRNGTLYVGVTSDIARRAWEPRNGGTSTVIWRDGSCW
jgi:predicted GIY-YIG superfamily endonuclease